MWKTNLCWLSGSSAFESAPFPGAGKPWRKCCVAVPSKAMDEENVAGTLVSCINLSLCLSFCAVASALPRTVRVTPRTCSQVSFQVSHGATVELTQTSIYICDMYICDYVHVWSCTCMIMYLCDCVHMWLCTYVFMYICGYMHLWLCTSVIMYICDHAHVWSCTRVSMYLCDYVHVWICTCMIVYMCDHVHVWSCTCVIMYICDYGPVHGEFHHAPHVQISVLKKLMRDEKWISKDLHFKKPDLENHIFNFLFFLHIGVSYFVQQFKDSHQTISHL